MHPIDRSRPLIRSIHLARLAWNYLSSLRQSTVDVVIISLFSIIIFCVEFVYHLAPILFQFAMDHEEWEIDNLIFVVFVLSIGFAIFSYRRVKELAVEMKARRS